MIFKIFQKGSGENSKEWGRSRIDLIPKKLPNESYCDEHFKMSLIKKYGFSGAKFLEAGCGDGTMVMLASKFLKYNSYGLDFSDNLIQTLNEKYKTNNFIVGNIIKLNNFENNELDLMTSFGVIEHLENGPNKAIKEMHRVIRKGGYLIISVPIISPFLIFNALRRNLLFFLGYKIKHKNQISQVVPKFSETFKDDLPFAQYNVSIKNATKYFDKLKWDLVFIKRHSFYVKAFENILKKILSETLYEIIVLEKQMQNVKMNFLLKLFKSSFHFIFGGMVMMVLKKK
jgi:ubiquinone/menaquinone biosynthesis C-methylase UbiE